MSIKIGNNNKIIDSNICDNIKIDSSTKDIKSNSKKNFYEEHPIICGLLISLAAGFILLFSFWNNIIDWIERWF